MFDNCQQGLWGASSETGHNADFMFKGLEMDNYSYSNHLKERGQNILEFALVLPLLAIVVFGVMDLGRVFFATIGLTNAAREGARYLTMNPDDVSHEYGDYWGSEAAVIDEANYSGITITGSDISVTCANVDGDDFCDSGTPATVIVTYDFGLILGWVLPSPITVTRYAEMIIP